MSACEPLMSIREQLEMEGTGWDGDLDAMRPQASGDENA